MSITKVTLAKESNTGIEYLYPKTTSDIVEYNNITVKEKLDSLDDGYNNIVNNIVNDINNIPGILEISKGGTSANTAPVALYNLSWRTVTENMDLNDFIGTEHMGYYYFGSAYIPANAPVNARGYLIVIRGGGSQRKQIWINQGGSGTNQNGIYVRSYDNYQWTTWNTISKNVALVGSDDANNTGWHKVASGTLSGYSNTSIMFAVHDTKSYVSGILNLDIRCSTSNGSDAIVTDSSNAQRSRLTWLITNGISENSTISLKDFMVVVNGTTWTMYYSVKQRYYRMVFEVIEESSINTEQAQYALYSNQTKYNGNLTATFISESADISSMHPRYTSHDIGFYKVSVDEMGHVDGVSNVTLSDITNLGVPTTHYNAYIYTGIQYAVENATTNTSNPYITVTDKEGSTKKHTSSIQLKGSGATNISANNGIITIDTPSMKTLTINGNGTKIGDYNGSADKTINITPSNIGAATSSHTHDEVTASAKGFMSTSQFIDVRDNLPNGRKSGSTIGTGSSAIGKSDNTVSGSYSAALGEGNTVLGSDSVAIGKSNSVSGGYSASLGFTNISTNAYSYALGSTNTINIGQSTAIGTNNIINGAYSTTVGHENTVRGRETYAFGSGNTVTNEDIEGSLTSSYHYACAIGCWNKAKGYVSMALGRSNTASGEDSYAIGRWCKATANKSFAIGGGVNWSSGQTYNTASGERSMAIGLDNNASSQDSYAIGRGNTAEGENSYGIGKENTASGQNSYAIGRLNTASGQNSMAIGVAASDREINNVSGSKSIALGTYNNISGDCSVAIGIGSHYNNAEDKNTVTGNWAYVIGTSNSATNSGVRIFGADNTVSGQNSYAIGKENTASGQNSYAIGRGNTAKGENSYAIGRWCKATANRSFAIGGGVNWSSGQTYNTASGERSMAIGLDNNASSQDSYAIGRGNTVSGEASMTIGKENTASGQNSYAIGGGNTVSGQNSYAIGGGNTVSGNNSVAIGHGSVAKTGQYNIAISGGTASAGKIEVTIHDEDDPSNTTSKYDIGGRSFAMGLFASASAAASVAIGTKTTANGIGEFVCGFANNNDNLERRTSIFDNVTGNAFIIGNGRYRMDGEIIDGNAVYSVTKKNGVNTHLYLTSNAFRVTTAGAVYAKAAYNSSGADYAEFIKEWYDGNPNNEDRVGYMVTIKNGKLHKANSGDYIIGITSGNPSVIGNADEDYFWMYERDKFNRAIIEESIIREPQYDKDGDPIFDENGNQIYEEKIVRTKKISSTYDSSKPYIERAKRPEWDYVGMRGIVPCRDDGTCEEGGFCKCGSDGIATKADTRGFDTYYVIERIDEETISVEVK